MVISLAVVGSLLLIGLMVTIGWQIVLISLKGVGILLALGILLYQLEQHGLFIHLIK